MFAVALRYHQAGRLVEAERLYRQILQVDSRHADALHFLGVLAHQHGRNEVAVDLILKAIAQNGSVPAFHNNLGNALKAQGKLTEAISSYGQALTYKPNYIEAHYNLGTALQAQGKLEEAAASYRRALSTKPDHADAHCNLGNTLQAQGRLDEAVSSYLCALRYKPEFAEAYINLGNVLKAQGKLEEAVTFYLRALTLKPGLAEAHANLGTILLEQGELEKAVARFHQSLALKPDYAEAYNYLGNALREQGKLDEGVACFHQALALKPDFAEARLHLAISTVPIFCDRVTESVGAIERFIQSLNDLKTWSTANLGKLGSSVGRNQPFYLAYRPGDVSVPLSSYGDLVSAAAATHWRQTSDYSRIQSPRTRIRVVVVSGQVRQHPAWEVLLRGIVAHLDRRQFELFIYHTGSITDKETAWASERAVRFVQGPKPMQGWLGEIAQDRPDVIFYPEVGMDPATCALAALRLAPLQVASWGHPVTTGLPTMDLFQSGELLEGQGADQHYREKLVRLPGTGACTEMFAVQAQRWDGGDRKEGTIRIALCQQPIKFDPVNDVLLARIARAVGPSEFWLASPKKQGWATVRLRDRLAAAFRAEGLDPDAHLRMSPWLPRDQFVGFLDAMDIYLDCPAFSGYTTAWQAIHRGLPIVTLEGEFMRQRLAAGLLRQIGLTDGIASSHEQYVQIAVRWAEECRQNVAWAARREAMRRAAPAADDNRSAVEGFERMIIGAL
ncbi:MAG TPA: tetratricopeptide repeat protein [Steroidobacteraceae bacterium]